MKDEKNQKKYEKNTIAYERICIYWVGGREEVVYRMLHDAAMRTMGPIDE